MKLIQIEETDIILQDYEKGQGKIIISNQGYGNFSYQWGAMNDNISDFICRINESYFIDKLSTSRKGDLNLKLTVRNFRQQIKEVMPFYKEMEFQKQLRMELKKIEGSRYSEEGLINQLSDLVSYKLDFGVIKDRYDRESMEDNIKSIFQGEVWYSFVYDEPKEHEFLKRIRKKLIAKLKKNTIN